MDRLTANTDLAGQLCEITSIAGATNDVCVNLGI